MSSFTELRFIYTPLDLSIDHRQLHALLSSVPFLVSSLAGARCGRLSRQGMKKVLKYSSRIPEDSLRCPEATEATDY
jgi:hypothetical protein